MTILQKFYCILSVKLPDWLGVLSFVVVLLLALALIFVLTFPGLVGNFLADHDIKFL